ncbi:flagellar brake domain-containing protein [Paenibacillus sp. J5C_2022]|uniref:flagellar brake protein n=1 Tax=Paenibacillus sp. J5C2022 TaxID=2977129 RepID=UPI0021D24B0D|nr:flagellar brake domain-containing protein [Paenibacillus sp. J5C2022]MCU6710036.1 flagellar brake domain-containing protein [Paenibacillus sp. J5C2022]
MLPKVNQMLYFQIASSDEAEAAVVYKSRIADEEDQALHIEYPISESSGRMKRLFLGDELSVYFMTGDGVKHFFDSHVIGFKEEEGLKLVKLMKPDPERMTKVQRRSFLRVPAELELAVKFSDHIRFLCHTDDIGGGGISFLCDNKWSFQQEQQIECWLLVPFKNGSVEHVPFKAEVVRINLLQSGRKQVMIKFIAISDTERQKIIRFCFEKQLEYRNR